MEGIQLEDQRPISENARGHPLTDEPPAYEPPPDYEAPPDYEEAIKMYKESMKIKESHLKIDTEWLSNF